MAGEDVLLLLPQEMDPDLLLGGTESLPRAGGTYRAASHCSTGVNRLSEARSNTVPISATTTSLGQTEEEAEGPGPRSGSASLLGSPPALHFSRRRVAPVASLCQHQTPFGATPRHSYARSAPRPDA